MNSLTRFLTSDFCHQTVAPDPIRGTLEWFRFFLNFHREIQILNWFTILSLGSQSEITTSLRKNLELQRFNWKVIIDSSVYSSPGSSKLPPLESLHSVFASLSSYEYSVYASPESCDSLVSFKLKYLKTKKKINYQWVPVMRTEELVWGKKPPVKILWDCLKYQINDWYKHKC